MAFLNHPGSGKEIYEAILVLIANDEIQNGHTHCCERWLGSGAADTFTPYVVTTGASGVYGTELLCIDTGDTPLKAGNAFFDVGRIFVSGQASGEIYKIRIAHGTGTHAEAITAGQYTEIMHLLNNAGATVYLKFPRIAVGTKVWVSAKLDDSAKAINFFFGIHEYPE